MVCGRPLASAVHRVAEADQPDGLAAVQDRRPVGDRPDRPIRCCMIGDEAPGPEYGELGYRMVELRLERQMRKLLTLVIVFGVLILLALLALAIMLASTPR